LIAAARTRPRPNKVALGVKQIGEIVEAHHRIGVLGPKRPLADRQRALVEWPRPREVALVLKHIGEADELNAVVGCPGPSTSSEIASARSRSARAPATSPWA
jgi:hypothetical protein